MADVKDYMEAARETDQALQQVDVFGSQIEDMERGGDLGILLAGKAIALAIREVGTRLDYVLRDLERNRR